MIATGTPSGATTNVAQLLSRYPQYPTGTGSESSGVLINNDSSGSSYFESFNVRVSKRFSRSGLNLIGNYIHSKLIERDSYLNDTDLTPEKRISAFDHPNRFVAAVTYELPVGHGKRFDLNSRLANSVAGGWKFNFIYTYQTGQPLIWANGNARRLHLLWRSAPSGQPQHQRRGFRHHAVQHHCRAATAVSHPDVQHDIRQPAPGWDQSVGCIDDQGNPSDGIDRVSITL